MSATAAAKRGLDDRRDRTHRARSDRIRPYTLATLPAELRKFTYWPSIDAAALDAPDLERFNKLKEAVEKYLTGHNMRPILDALKINYETLYRAVRRCTTRHDDGLVFGYRALIPWMHVKKYTRTKPAVIREGARRGGFSGAMSLLLKRHPTIGEELDHYLLTRTPAQGGEESRITLEGAHSYFLQLCASEGISGETWPLCTKMLGKNAIRDYVRCFFDKHYTEIAEYQYGDAAKVKSETGTGVKSRLTAAFPYDVIEVDEHRAHFVGSIGIQTPSGKQYVPIGRVTIITVVDRRSGVVLGYEVVFAREATANDVLQAIHNALQPWAPRVLRLKGLAYEDNAGFPSGRLPCLAGCGWAMLLLDNALAHLADEVIFRAREFLGCDINLGPVHTPSRRPTVEGAYRALNRKGFVRVPSTTGSNVTDPLRRDPCAVACKMRLDAECVLDLIEVAIASYNATESIRTHGKSGLDFLEYFAQDEDLGTLLPELPPRPPHIPPLNVRRIMANITGSRDDGVRPRVYALNDCYTSTALAKRFDLIGSEVILHVDPRNVSSVEAYEPSGAYIGRLTCTKEWGADEPCSLDARNAIVDLVRQGKLSRNAKETYPQAFLRALSEQALADGARSQSKVSDAARELADEKRKQNAVRKDDTHTGSNVVPDVANDESAPGPDDENAAPLLSDEYCGLPLVIPLRIKAVN